MSIRYAHTNLIAKNWKQLADFYVNVFDCKPTHSTQLSGEYLAKGTGVKDAVLEGINLQLPGYETLPPTLEIFQYTDLLEKAVPIVAKEYSKGTSTYIYLADPEGNIVELQNWTPK